MIPRCPVCNSLAGTSRTAAGKRMWCTARGCMWSAVVAEEELTGRDMCAVVTEPQPEPVRVAQEDRS